MDPAPAETAIGDPANRSPPDVENNEKMPVQEHADADDLYQDISAPNGEDELNRNPCASNGKHSRYAPFFKYLSLSNVMRRFGSAG